MAGPTENFQQIDYRKENSPYTSLDGFNIADVWNKVPPEKRPGGIDHTQNKNGGGYSIDSTGSITFGSTNDNRKPYDTTNPYGRSENNVDIMIRKTWSF
ncbi:MAG: hypothetical protein K2X77_14650 [Candidatus Obscuribacterales bacterium]|jgi:hypothetical protein|nr:hypothetical protein [Candidatus Obscuribacterales bacterium]